MELQTLSQPIEKPREVAKKNTWDWVELSLHAFILLQWFVFWLLDLKNAQVQHTLWVVPLSSLVMGVLWYLLKRRSRRLLSIVAVFFSLGLLVVLDSIRPILRKTYGIPDVGAMGWMSLLVWCVLLGIFALQVKLLRKSTPTKGESHTVDTEDEDGLGFFRALSIGQWVAWLGLWVLFTNRADNGLHWSLGCLFVDTCAHRVCSPRAAFHLKKEFLSLRDGGPWMLFQR